MERTTTQLRRLLARGELIVAPGAYDAASARVIESLGFPAVYMGGNATGIHLCTTEPLTTLTETVDAAVRIVRGIEVPLIADADAGFGDAVHTYRTIRELERAGVAAVHLEDQLYPKRVHYHRGQGRLIELAEAKDKLNAALDARRDPDFVIIARTDAMLAVGSLEMTIERLLAYRELGADVLMVAGRSTPEQGRAIRQAVPDTPLVWLSGTSLGGPELSTREIATLGYQIVLYSGLAIFVALEAVMQTFAHLRDHGTTGVSDERVVPIVKRLFELVGMPKYWEIEARTTERA
ncbi:MAG: isocitrate lyase/PEP mutase family protein [Chloroflexi bacterium]|nr:isocitrate lyase/PEP mutase family protein [Chloroflexota bacterium]